MLATYPRSSTAEREFHGEAASQVAAGFPEEPLSQIRKNSTLGIEEENDYWKWSWLKKVGGGWICPKSGISDPILGLVSESWTWCQNLGLVPKSGQNLVGLGQVRHIAKTRADFGPGCLTPSLPIIPKLCMPPCTHCRSLCKPL